MGWFLSPDTRKSSISCSPGRLVGEDSRLPDVQWPIPCTASYIKIVQRGLVGVIAALCQAMWRDELIHLIKKSKGLHYVQMQFLSHFECFVFYHPSPLPTILQVPGMGVGFGTGTPPSNTSKRSCTNDQGSTSGSQRVWEAGMVRG